MEMRRTIPRSSFVAAVMITGTLLTSTPIPVQAGIGSELIKTKDEAGCVNYTHSLVERRGAATSQTSTYAPYLGTINFCLVQSPRDASYDDATPPLANADTIPTSDGGRAEQVALAAIGTLLLGGALVSMSRPLPVNNKGTSGLDQD